MSSALVMTVRRRSTSRHASSSVVVPLEIAIVWPSTIRSAAAVAIARFAARRGSWALLRPVDAGAAAAPP